MTKVNENNKTLFSSTSECQKSQIHSTGLKSRWWQGHSHSVDSRGESTPIFFQALVAASILFLSHLLGLPLHICWHSTGFPTHLWDCAFFFFFFFPFVSQTRKSQLTYLQFSHCFFCHFKSATELLTWLFVISVVTFQLQIFGLFFIISISSQIFSTWWKTTPILYFSSLNIVSFNTLNIFLTADLKSA